MVRGLIRSRRSALEPQWVSALGRAAMVGGAFVVLAVLAAPAVAEQVTIGVASPQSNTNGFHTGGTVIQTALPGTDTVAVPATGRIVAWWATGQGAQAGARLRVVHTTTGGQFTAEQTSREETLSAAVVTFPASLPVHAEDLIGVTIHDGDGESGISITEDPASAARVFDDEFPNGTTETGTLNDQEQLQLGARFFFAPVVSHVAASSGSTAGHQRVVITGDHLSGSTAVRFGSTPAASFRIVSNTRITAVTPHGAAATVHVRVVGPGGTSATSPGDRYRFIAPEVRVAPASLSFGTEPVGGASAVRAVRLTNTGSVPVSVGKTSLSGADPADFTRFSDSCSQQRIAPGHSCSVKLVFAPRATGARRAILVIRDNGLGGPHRVSLTGTGR
ncbi:MAG: choice-of-anchor D domain-containing protein [Solirubrobacteraceae bacterium]